MAFCVQAFLAMHFLQSAAVTVLLSRRRVSPASETKLGKAPKDIEYVGELITPITTTCSQYKEAFASVFHPQQTCPHLPLRWTS